MKTFAMTISLDKFVLFKGSIQANKFKIPAVIADGFNNRSVYPDMTGRKSCAQSEVMCNISFNLKPEHELLVLALASEFASDYTGK